MNYANVFGRTQKQFDMTMNREKITVTDFFNSNTKYDVFSHQRNGRDPDCSYKKPFIQLVRIRIFVGGSAAPYITERHRDHDGANNDRPHDLRRTEIRRQQPARTQLHRHHTHPGKKLRHIKIILVF